MSAVDDSVMLSRYLLHEVDAREQEEIERRYFSDPEYLALMEAVEGDLIDAYVRRELTRTQRARFEKYFLCTRARRERLRLAEALQAQLGTQQQQATAMWPRIAMAVAATVIIVVGISIWVSRPSPLAPRPSVPTVKRTTPPPVTLAITLMPGLTRDDAAPQRIVLRPDVDEVRVSAVVDVEGEWRDLRATLGDWSASGLVMGADRTVTVVLPASRLTPGEHVLVLTAGGEALGDYAFVVEPAPG